MPCRFELGEVLWQDPNPAAPTSSLAHGLALSERASNRKASLIAAGRLDDAQEIQTWGSFGAPALASLLQMLQKKCYKRYNTDGAPLSLLLYYGRQSPLEPFERLTDRYREVLHSLLTGSQFSDVWLYHHPIAYSFSFSAPAGPPERIPLREFETPESQRGVIGHLTITPAGVTIALDASYSQLYDRASDELDEARRQWQREHNTAAE